MSIKNQIIAPAITTEVVCDYLSAEFGHDLALWRDGRTQVIPTNAVFENDESPIARCQCPGILNIDRSLLESAQDDDHADLSKLIQRTCANGDVTCWQDEIINAMERSMSEHDTMTFAFISRHEPTTSQIAMARDEGIELLHVGDTDAFTVSPAFVFMHGEHRQVTFDGVVVHPAAALRLAGDFLVGVFENANRAEPNEKPRFEAQALHLFDLRD